MIHFITPLYRYNNIKIIYSSIIHQISDFNWHLIEGSETIGEENINTILEDSRVKYYKIETNYTWGHEQRNFFISNIVCEDNDWCFFLDDDTTVTSDLIDVFLNQKDGGHDIFLLSQKSGLTEIVRCWGLPGRLKLGYCDIGSFLIKYSVLKNTKINHEEWRNSDGHYADQLADIPNIKIKYLDNKFTRYNSLSINII
jgi:hypothetical protein